MPFCISATINVELRLVCNEIESRSPGSDVSRSTLIIISSYFFYANIICPLEFVFFFFRVALFSMSMLIFSCFLLWPFFFSCYARRRARGSERASKRGRKKKNLVLILFATNQSYPLSVCRSICPSFTIVWHTIAFDSLLLSFIGGFQWISFFYCQDK